MASKKTAARKTTAKKTTARSTRQSTAAPEEQVSVGQKSCAYPSCSQRAAQEFGDNNVPSCSAHAGVFETQSQDGAGIQHLMENYRG